MSKRKSISHKKRVKKAAVIQHGIEQRKKIAHLYEQTGGNVSLISRMLGLSRCTTQHHLRKMGITKPIAAGSVEGETPKVEAGPRKGNVKRYILTSAQNNTYVYDACWTALLALSRHLDAQLMVGTFTYNQNEFGEMSVKLGTVKEKDRELWYDPKITRYISDRIHQLAPGLSWCGNMNILPTNDNPFAGMEAYEHRNSIILPHAKMRMKSVAAMMGEGAKLMYTTGTVTQKNYIQKREGQKAEQHHVYGAVLVEVDDNGNWWVRQLDFNSQEVIQDLDVIVEDGHVTTGHAVENITWGDLHGVMADMKVVELSQTMLDFLRPKSQTHHDVLAGESTNRHLVKNQPAPHNNYYRWARGFHRVDAEILASVPILERYHRDWCEMIVPDSNHDGWWLKSWLQKYDHRYDPPNMALYLDCQKWMVEQIALCVKEDRLPKTINIMDYVMKRWGMLSKPVKFLLPDESYLLCDGRIEAGMHGHLGPDGARGTPDNLSKIGRRANTAHTHSCGIYNGLYVAGTSSKLIWDYNYGPSSWTHSHIVTYPSGSRTMITMYNNKWRA